jgi:hypothetical protein
MKKKLDLTQSHLREYIFKLKSKQFNSFAQSLIKNNFSHRGTLNIRVNFIKALSPLNKIDSIEQLLFSIVNDAPVNRMFKSTEWKKYKFDCNIQQIKKKSFDILYYGIFFSDKVQIFKITPELINDAIQYSDKQHKGNIGEGQFHLNNRTYQYHLDNFLEKELTYEQILANLIKLQDAGKLNSTILTIILSIVIASKHIHKLS